MTSRTISLSFDPIIDAGPTRNAVFNSTYQLSMILGAASIALLSFLLVFRTPNHCKPYSRVLLISVVADAYMVIALYLSQPVCCVIVVKQMSQTTFVILIA